MKSILGKIKVGIGQPNITGEQNFPMKNIITDGCAKNA